MTDRVVKALQAVVPATRGQVDLGSRTLRWVESGTGTPTVVLIAGRNDTLLAWGPVLAALAGRAHAVAYDRAGLGDSDPDAETPAAGPRCMPPWPPNAAPPTSSSMAAATPSTCTARPRWPRPS
jgi:pimeloyl-ACP methyl ester carboxylesterase